MTNRFDKAFDYMIVSEGGYCNVKGDNGGETNFGLSSKFLNSIGYNGVIKNMKLSEAKEIYYKYFWKSEYEQMQDRVAIKVFDISVNAGHARSHKILQQAINSLGSKLVVDGVIGKGTLTELLKYTDYKILVAIKIVQSQFYNNIVKANPSQGKFLRGWLNRSNRLPE